MTLPERTSLLHYVSPASVLSSSPATQQEVLDQWHPLQNPASERRPSRTSSFLGKVFSRSGLAKQESASNVDVSSSGGDGVKRDRLTICQWNVWFDSKYLRERTSVIINHILYDLPTSSPPDILALQELTLPTYRLFLSHPLIQSHYLLTDFPTHLKEAGTWYGCCLFVSRKLAGMGEGGGIGAGVEAWTVGCAGMKSNLGRYLLGVDIPRLGVRLMTSHFESPIPRAPGTAERAHQFSLAESLAHTPIPISIPSPTPTSTSSSNASKSATRGSAGGGRLPGLCMVCGDTNVISEVEVPSAFPESLGWSDAWLSSRAQLRSKSESGQAEAQGMSRAGMNSDSDPNGGYTFGLTYANDRHGFTRLDRMLYLYNPSSSGGEAGGKWVVGRCETFGKDLSVRGGGGGVILEDKRGREGKCWASDHEGLFTEFVRTG